MSRRSWHLVGALSLALVLLIVAATALAKPVTPKTGLFSGSGAAPGVSGSSGVAFKVSKSGKKFGVEVTITPLNLKCKIPSGGELPISGSAFSSKSFKSNGKGAPLKVKGGKFSFKGPVYGGPSSNGGEGEISGTFKSPKKVVATASFSWPSVELVAGQTAPCESGKLALSGLHK